VGKIAKYCISPDGIYSCDNAIKFGVKMFQIRLSMTFNNNDCEEDLELSVIPSVGDLINVHVRHGTERRYRVLDRMFDVLLDENGKELKGFGQSVLLHVKHA
jgi:hypothetical protein